MDPEPRGAPVLVLCLLTGPSEFVVDLEHFLTEVGKFRKNQIDMHGVLSDACLLVTCCVTNERWKVTCFVTHADPLTTLCREGSVEAIVNLHLRAKVKSCLLMYGAVCTVSAFSLVRGCNT